MEIDEFVYVYRIDGKDFLQGKQKIVLQLEDLDKQSKNSAKKLDGLNRTIADGGKSGVKAFSDLSKAALGFFGVSLTVGGITAMFNRMTRNMTQLGNQSAYLDIPVKRLDGLERAANAAGVSTGELVGNLKNMRDAQAWLRQGYSNVNQYTQAMARLQSISGVDLTDARDTDQLFTRTRQALRAIHDKDLRLMLANELGFSSSLQRTTNDGSFDKNADDFTSRSAVNQDQINKAQKLAVQIEALNQSYSNLGQRLNQNVGVPLAEKILPVLEDFVTYLTDHEKDIADFFENCSSGVKGFADAVGGAENAVKLLIGAYVALKAKGVLTAGAELARGAVTSGGVLAVGGAYVSAMAANEVAGRIKSLREGRGYDVIASQSAEMGELERLKQENRAAYANQYAQSARNPRGIRNNNPGNIEFRGQKNAKGSDGRYATFATPYDGIKALTGQLMRYYNGQTTGKPLRTVADIISTWAPSSENDTGSYIANVSKSLGVTSSEKINLNDQAVMQKLVTAIISHENGRNPYDSQTINRAVADSRTFNPEISRQYQMQQRASDLSQSVQNSSTVNNSSSETHINNVIVNQPVRDVNELTEQIQRQARNSRLTAPYISGVR